MKKLCVLSVIILIVASFALSACDSAEQEQEPHNGEDMHYNNGYNNDYISDEAGEDAPNFAGQEQVLQAAPASLNLTRECFLHDFDYLMTMLEENAPYFSLIYRRNGVDMLALIPELRARLEDESQDINLASFFNLIQNEFFYHALPVTHLWFESYLELRHRGMLNDAENIDGILRYRQRLGPVQRGGGGAGFLQGISTSVIEEGRIAYISIPAFDNTPTPQQIQLIDDFYSQIEDFEHLIIDLRGNPGGWTHFFDELIIAPLLMNPLQARFHNFFQGGSHNLQFFEGFGVEPWRFQQVNDDFLRRMFWDGLSQAVVDDLAIMDYSFHEVWTVHADPARRINFNGRIWMLTDGYMASGAHMVAAFYCYVGFTTLVGETTGGMYVSRNIGSNIIQLPRTGLFLRYDMTYVLDANGRAVDYGIDPHYFNLPGMDALETVLELIRRGN